MATPAASTRRGNANEKIQTNTKWDSKNTNSNLIQTATLAVSTQQFPWLPPGKLK